MSSKDLIETPEKLEEYIGYVMTLYNNVVEEQLYLLDNGVSFDYTDEIDNQTRKDLIEQVNNWRKDHPRRTLF